MFKYLLIGNLASSAFMVPGAAGGFLGLLACGLALAALLYDACKR